MKKIVFLSVLSLLAYSCSGNINNPTSKVESVSKQVNINTNKYKLIGKAEFPRELNVPPIKNDLMREQLRKDENLLNGEIPKSPSDLKEGEKPVLKSLNINSQKINELRTINKTKPNSFKVKASLDDITKLGTISLIYLPDHPTQANKTIGTGTTAEDGTFSLDISPNVIISNGDIFILEATTRLGGSGTSSMSVRTYIKWDDVNKQWKSMTTPSLLINTKTTALAIIDNKEVSITPDNTIDKINVSGTTALVTGINSTITSTVINNLDKIVEKIVYQGRDAYSLIKYENNIFSYDSSYDLRRLTQTRDCSRCILSYINLSRIDLTNKNLNHADLSGKNLSYLDFSGSFLVNTNLSGATLIQTNFTNADLTGANLKGSLFQQATLTNAILDKADFSNARVYFINFNNLSLKNSVFNNTTLHATNFTGADLSYSDFRYMDTYYSYQDGLTKPSLNNAILTGINFLGQPLYYYISLNNIKGYDFSNKDLTDANFTYSDCEYANFSNSILKNSDFTGSFMYKTTFDGADLSYANLSNLIYVTSTDLTDDTRTTFLNAYMEYADLSNFNFRGINRVGVSLRGALFFEKDFSNYDLTNADLSFSMLKGANLSNAVITNTNFAQAHVDNMKWIDGTTTFPSNKICDENSIGACN